MFRQVGPTDEMVAEFLIERRRSAYHFHHFKPDLPLETAKKCDSLRGSAKAVTEPFQTAVDECQRMCWEEMKYCSDKSA